MSSYTLKNRGAFAARISITCPQPRLPGVDELVDGIPENSSQAQWDPLMSTGAKDPYNKDVLAGQNRTVRTTSLGEALTLKIQVNTGSKWKTVLDESPPQPGEHTWKVSGTTGNIKLVKQS